jgi:hypothetical protein
MEKKPGSGEQEDNVLATQLNAALESTKQTVADLNAALAPQNGKPVVQPVAPIQAAPVPSCPTEGRSA